MPRAIQTWSPTPAALMAGFVAIQVIVWTLVPASTFLAPPLDVVEGYAWGHEWVLATYKHPALPSWVLEASRLLTGTVGWPAYLASQLFIAATLLLVFLLGRDLLDEPRATAGTLVLAGCVYFGWPTPEFNHNVAQLPFWAALPLAVWRAVERKSLVWWIIGGAVAAAGLYAKLSTCLLIGATALWILWDARARRCLASPAPWIGLAVFLATLMPLVFWLSQHSYGPLAHAAERTAPWAHAGVGSVLLNSFASLTAMALMLVVSGVVGVTPRIQSQDAAAPAPDARVLAFLAALIAVPPILAGVAALLLHSGVKAAWFSSMFNLVGLIAVALTSSRFRAYRLTRLAAVAVFLVLAAGAAEAAIVALNVRPRGVAMRVDWPQAEMAQRMSSIWTRETGRPLRIVAGETRLAGLIALTAPDRPSVFTDGSFAKSPWITPERLDREGALIVWEAGRASRLPSMADALPRGVAYFKWPRGDRPGDLAIGYAILAPKKLD